MFRKSILASTLSLLLVPVGAWGLGLGGIRPESALNQPFVGEIELIGANPDELDAVKVVLATDAEFAKRGTERPHYLTQLRFKPQISPRGRPVVRITSTEPIREPYMDFLLEVIWPKGRLVKGFTVLLDPPVSGRRAQPSMERPVVEQSAVVAVSAAGRASDPGAAPGAPSPAVAAARPVVPAGATGNFPLNSAPVGRGAGLWRVARGMAPAGASVTQTVMALYRNNQAAFVRGDINKLRQGAVLQIPTQAELFALDAATADREFRSAVSGRPVTARPLTDVAAAPRAEEPRLRIAGAEQPGAPTEGQASPGPAPRAKADIEQELLLVRETGESTRQETDELRARVHQLEGNLSDIQQLLKLRNAELARLQAAGVDETPSGSEPSGTALPETRISAGGAATTGAGVAPLSGASGSPREEGGLSEQDTALAPAMTQEQQSAAEIEPGAALETAAPGPGAEGVAADPRPASPQGRNAKIPAAPHEDADASWMDGVPVVGGALKSLPKPVLWAALVTLPVFGVLGWLSVRRRRRIEADLKDFALRRPVSLNDEVAPGTAPMPSAASAGQPAESAQAYGLASDGSDDAGLGGIDEEGDGSDVTSEADIYIAYGRYRDAEDLLRQAIAKSPRRAELQYKLAEVYVEANNRAGLAKLIGDMEQSGLDRARPEQWSRLVAQLGVLDEQGVQPAAAASAGSVGGVAGPVGAGQRLDDFGRRMPADGNLLEAADSLMPDGLGSRDLTLATGALDLGDFDVGADRAQREREQFSTPASLSMPGADLDLSLADLDSATDADLAALGFGSMGGIPVASSAGSTLNLDQGRGIELDIDFDNEPPVELIQDTQIVTDDLGLGWGEHDGSPGRVAQDSDSALGDSRFETLSLHAVDGANDLLGTEWELEAGLWDEVATKLDLGRAYVEMNDREAAEAILLEVADEGTAAQQDEARALIRSLKTG